MDEHVLPGDPPVRVLLRRSARARRYTLRVSRLDGRVTLTIPSGASEARALAFARERAAWIRLRLAEQPEKVTVDIGTVLPVGGVSMVVVRGPKSRLLPGDGRIEVSSRARSVPGAVSGLLRTMARERLVSACDGFSAALGLPYARITLRDTRSRWGSCSADRALMFSWRLVLAPPQILDYVAAHEVAHLAEMNHGPMFWNTVERLWPEYREHRAWLRANGEELHRFRFGTLTH